MAPTDDLKVDPTVYYNAARTLSGLSDDIGTAVIRDLLPGMPTSPGMGGSYPAVAAWNTACHTVAGEVRTAILAYAGALAHFSDILNAAGYNWDAAEYNATLGSKGEPPTKPAVGTTTPLAEAAFPEMADPKNFNCAGLLIQGPGGFGDSHLLNDAPNGSVALLGKAAAAWTAFAGCHELTAALDALNTASRAFDGVQAPEVADIQKSLSALHGGAAGIKNSVASLASAISQHHDDLISARQQLMDAAPDAFPEHRADVTSAVDDCRVTVSLAATVSADEIKNALTGLTATAAGSDLFQYLGQSTDGKGGFRAGSDGTSALTYLPQLQALNELPILIESGDQNDNATLIGELDKIAAWHTPAAALTAVNLDALDRFGPQIKAWAIAAVKYGNEAGVDPSMVLAMVLQEGAPLHTGYFHRGPEFYAALQSLTDGTGKLNPDYNVDDHNAAAKWWDIARYGADREGVSKHSGDPNDPGNSIGLTNLKKDPFYAVKASFPDQFGDTEWKDLRGNDDLAIKATAYNLKLIDEQAAVNANSSVKLAQPLDQFLGSGYNAGGTPWHANEIGQGKADFQQTEVEHGQKSVEMVDLANKILQGSGAYR